MSEVLYPHGYGLTMLTLDELKRRHRPFMHPEFERRLFPWIEAQGGTIGIGGGYRITQPAKPGFAPAGKSFHQDQHFASGFTGYCAVDLVRAVPGKIHRAPTWSEVPAQGSDAARQYRVHCNVAGESWHMQPYEIDGYDSWVKAGRPDPKPLPPPPPITLPLENDMPTQCINRDGKYWLWNLTRKAPLGYPGNDLALIALLWWLEDNGVEFGGHTPANPRPIPKPIVLPDVVLATFDAAPTS